MSKSEVNLPPLTLKKSEERRLRAGHLWVFSNEVDTKKTPLSGFEPGQNVLLRASNGKPLGTAYVNPNSLICARLVSRDPGYELNKSLIVHRLNIALSMRARFFDQPFYRLFYGESDGLPGLVIDRYGDVIVVQINTAGMERHRDDVIAALQSVVKPAAILFRNDSTIRELEGLDRYIETAFGTVPDTVRIEEGGVRFDVPMTGGQKTGWFYDHADNRSRALRYVEGKRVLDVFSYIGAWGVRAAAAGASEVICVDSSGQALERVGANAELNNLGDRLSGFQGDAFAVLAQLRTEQERFDTIILDPPAFIKRKRDIKKGEQGYRRLNQAAMQLLNKDGILISASCSSHLRRGRLRDLMRDSARHIDRDLQILEQGHQSIDHPVHPAIPETDYIKAFFGRVLPAH